jgi:hypothetical protein
VRFKATHWFRPSTALFPGVLHSFRNLHQLRFRSDLTLNILRQLVVVAILIGAGILQGRIEK